MFLKTVAAGLVALTALAAVPANATTVAAGYYERPRWDGPRWDGPRWDNHRRHDKLSTREVRRILRHKGYRNINFVDRRGATYEVIAHRNHRSYYIVVSAWSGDILARNRI
jgi:hypothetical protein